MSAMKSSSIEERTEKLLEPILQELGSEADEEGKTAAFECVDVEYVKEGSNYYLRIYVDKEGGININDCEAISRRIEAELDREDFIPEAYILEVSSPGLTRPLKKEKDFARSIGKLIFIKTYQKVDGSKEFTGYLASYTDECVTIKEDDSERTFDRNDISLVRLAYDPNEDRETD